MRLGSVWVCKKKRKETRCSSNFLHRNTKSSGNTEKKRYMLHSCLGDPLNISRPVTEGYNQKKTNLINIKTSFFRSNLEIKMEHHIHFARIDIRLASTALSALRLFVLLRLVRFGRPGTGGPFGSKNLIGTRVRIRIGIHSAVRHADAVQSIADGVHRVIFIRRIDA